MADEKYRYWIAFAESLRSGGQYLQSAAFDFGFNLDTPEHVHAAEAEIKSMRQSQNEIAILNWKRLD